MSEDGIKKRLRSNSKKTKGSEKPAAKKLKTDKSKSKPKKPSKKDKKNKKKKSKKSKKPEKTEEEQKKEIMASIRRTMNGEPFDDDEDDDESKSARGELTEDDEKRWREILECRLEDLRDAVDDIDPLDDDADDIMEKLAEVRVLLDHAEDIPPAEVHQGPVAVFLSNPRGSR